MHTHMNTNYIGLMFSHPDIKTEALCVYYYTLVLLLDLTSIRHDSSNN